jgi:hypothetical protein
MLEVFFGMKIFFQRRPIKIMKIHFLRGSNYNITMMKNRLRAWEHLNQKQREK